ncbi:MAG TPA: PA14 domain-containing protein [Sedimentisphaerales bacterium]|nr:PA14 domain-containing protein [Sedimentisphaerales bacterium]
MYKKSFYLPCFFLAIALGGAIQAAPLAPDDGSVKDNLCLWLRSPDVNYDPDTGIWTDLSGKGNDAVAMGEIAAWGVTYAGPTLSIGSNPTVFDHEFGTVKFSADVDDLMRAANINGGAGLSELTIIGVYKLYNQSQSGAGMTRPLGIGSFIGEEANLGDYFNLANDVSIRKDNGSVGGATATHPDNAFFIRAARMNPSTINQWFNTDGTLQQVHAVSGSSYTTSVDNFYLGDMRADSTSGGGTSGYSRSDMEIAEVVVYNTDLTDAQIQGISEWLQANLRRERKTAFGPKPQDGTILSQTWAILGWEPGISAVSHNIYIGDDRGRVDEATADDVDIFAGSTASTGQTVGFPGFPVPEGLQPGTTYYWRIDEVNDADPDSPWKGKVWSFSVPPRTAYNPRPADGAKFVDPNVELTWTGGFGAILHTVYFGNNFDDVNTAAAGTAQAAASYRPVPLELETVYYWRVDEFDGLATHKGNVRSFTTTKAGGGLQAEYFNNTILTGEPVLSRLDPEIDFNWGNADVPGENSPDASISVDNFSARWTGELEVDLTDTYTFHINANNGFRLWLDGKPIINYWANPTTSRRHSDPVELVGGSIYSIRMEYSEGDDVAIAQLFWQSSTREQQIIPSGALQPSLRAGDPNPYDGAADVNPTTILSWRPAEAAASHQVYFGTDAEAVKNATAASPEYKGSKVPGQETFDPGKLPWESTFYWRVDEINNNNPDSPWVGKVWGFTTGGFLLVEDFESYNDLPEEDPASNRIYLTWIDGFETPLTNGAFVGNMDPPLMELGTVHGGFQSMPYRYDNNLKYSEATMTLTSGKDWTAEGVAELSLWFRGSSANAAERMYVALNGTAVVYHDNPNAARQTIWTEWMVPLQAFADQGVNLTNVTSISIGFGTRGNTTLPGGTGQMYFDDIRLYGPRTVP